MVSFASPSQPFTWATPNAFYFYGALEILVISGLSIIPNVYFLVKAYSNDLFKSRKMLKDVVIILSYLNLYCCLHACLLVLIFLVPYWSGAEIPILFCTIVRNASFVALSLVLTTPLVLYLQRYFSILQNVQFSNKVAFGVILIINVPGIINLVGHHVGSTLAYVTDDICTYNSYSTSPLFQAFYKPYIALMFISPLLALAVNFGTFFQLKHINKKNVNIKRDKEEKKLLVTLTVQAIYPCLCFLPTVVVGTYVAATHQNLFIYWRFLDLIQYSTFGTTVPLSVIFIKEIRYMILCDLHLMTKTPSNNTNVSSRKVRLTKTDP